MFVFNLINKKYYEISDGITVGRKSSADLCFPEDETLSGKHCEFKVKNNKVYIVDLGSTNGTFVNDSQIKPDKAVKLSEPDHITIGDQKFIFVDTDEKSAEELEKLVEGPELDIDKGSISNLTLETPSARTATKRAEVETEEEKEKKRRGKELVQKLKEEKIAKEAEKIPPLKQQIDEISKLIPPLEQSIQELQAKQETERQFIKQLQENEKIFAEELKQADEVLATIPEQITPIKDALGKIEKEKETYESQLEQKSEKQKLVESLGLSEEDYQSEIDEYRSKIATLEEKKQESSNQLKQLRSKQDDLNQNKVTIKQKVNANKQAIDNEDSRCAAAVKELQDEIDAHNSQITQHKQEIEKTEQRIKNIELAIEEIRNK